MGIMVNGCTNVFMVTSVYVVYAMSVLLIEKVCMSSMCYDTVTQTFSSVRKCESICRMYIYEYLHDDRFICG